MHLPGKLSRYDLHGHKFVIFDLKGCQLVGPGACRGKDWSDDDWPQVAGEKTVDQCCSQCQQTKGCTAFSLGKAKKAKKPCLLYNHRDIQPASSLGGECYKITSEGIFRVQ